MNSAIILISGLPLTRKTSFSRQLGLLGEFLKKSEIDSITTDSREHTESLVQKRTMQAAILLGYPDQFPFLMSVQTMNIPIFLWAQFSCPPDPESLGNALPVPLTGKSKDFLFEAGASNVGPVVPHGIDTSIYYPISNEERNKVKTELGLDARFVVGTVGANTRRKKFDKILETFALFAKKNSDTLLLIKTDRVVSIDGTDLDKIARKLDVYSRTKIIVDELSEQEMRALYGSMDMYLNLSEWEGFCIPIIEAMSCGIPVVSLPIQGPGEILPYKDLMVTNYATLNSGKTVLFIADPKKTEPVLTYARRNPSLLKRAKQLGIQAAQEQYDIRRIVKLWLDLLKNRTIIT